MSIVSSEDTVILLYPQETPYVGFLGGLPKNGTSRVHMVTAYGSLPRPSALPPRRFSFRNKGVEKAFLKIFDGDFILAWKVKDGKTLVATAAVHHESVPMRFRGMPLFGMCLREEERLERGISFGNIECNKKFAAALSSKQGHALSFRILHHFIRALGASFSPQWLKMACTALFNHCKDNELYTEAVNVSMTKADVFINLQLGNLEIGKALIQVGEYLEADERYLEAARVYKEVVQSYFTCKSSDSDVRAYFKTSSEVSSLWAFCGLAFKRAGDFKSAEEAYVKALHFSRVHSGGDHLWDLNEEHTALLLWNVSSMYSAIRKRAEGTPQETESSSMELTFDTLLYTSGFRPGNDLKSTATFMRKGAMFEGTLKPTFKTRTGAKQALVLATQTQSVNSFRSVVFSCRDPSRLVISVEYEDPSNGSKKSAKQTAREAVEDHVSGIIDICSNPVCSAKATWNGSSGAFKGCPCKRVYYCQRSCQVAHWRQHKFNCEYHAKRKEEKKHASNKTNDTTK